jgi:hypothetical protein
MGFDNRGISFRTVSAKLIGFFDLEDTVLFDDSDEHKQSKHGIEIQRCSQEQQG